MTATKNANTTQEISSRIAAVLSRTANRTASDRRWNLKEALMAFRAVDLREFLAIEGVRFTGKPKRDEIVAEILDTFTPEENS